MATEVEVKTRCPDPGAVERKLHERGARLKEVVMQTDTYFRAPHVDFAATDEALRIRRETLIGPLADGGGAGVLPGEGDGNGGKEAGGGPKPAPIELGTRAFLTYKGPKEDELTKTRVEHETPVDDPAVLAAILRSLGFEPVMDVRKTRRTYTAGQLEVCIDDVDGLGTFCEVEYAGALDDPGTSDGVEHAGDAEEAGGGPRGAVMGLAGELGLEGSIRTSYLEMLLEKQ